MSIHSRYDDYHQSTNASSIRKIRASQSGALKCETCRQSTAHVRIANLYCNQCLSNVALRRMRDSMVQNCSIPRYQRAILAYSGGAFSTFLLNAMMKLRSIPMDPLPWLSSINGLSQDNNSYSTGSDLASGLCLPESLSPLILPQSNSASRLAIQEKDSQIYSRYLSGLPDGLDLNNAKTADILRIDPNPDKSLQPARILPVWIDERPLSYLFAGGSSVLKCFRESEEKLLPEGIRITPPTGARSVPVIELPQNPSEVERLYFPQFVPSVNHEKKEVDASFNHTDSVGPAALLESLALYPHIRFVKLPNVKSLTKADILQSRLNAESQKRKNKKKEAKKKETDDVSEQTAPEIQDEKTQEEVKAEVIPEQSEEERLHSLGEVVVPVLVVPIGWPLDAEGDLKQIYEHRIRTIRAMFVSLATSTERQDFISKLVKRQLIGLAARLDCPRVVFGDTLSSTAISIIQNMAKANGITLPANANYTECIYPAPKVLDKVPSDGSVREDEHVAESSNLSSLNLKLEVSQVPVFVHRPLRDFTTKFVYLLLHYWKLPYALTPQLLSRHDLLTNGSINRLATTFLAHLDKGNDLSSHNVVRTLEKVRVPGTKVPGSGRVVIPDYPMRDLKSSETQAKLLEEAQNELSGADPQSSTKPSAKQMTTALSTSALCILLSKLKQKEAEMRLKSESEAKKQLAGPESGDTNSVGDGTEDIHDHNQDGEGQDGGRVVDPKDPSEWQGKTELSIEEIRARARDRGRKLASEYAIVEENDDQVESSVHPETDNRDTNKLEVEESKIEIKVVKSDSSQIPAARNSNGGCGSSNGGCSGDGGCGNTEVQIHAPISNEDCGSSSGNCKSSKSSEGSCKSKLPQVPMEDDPDLDDAPSCGRPIVAIGGGNGADMQKSSLTSIRGRSRKKGGNQTVSGIASGQVSSEHATDFLRANETKKGDSEQKQDQERDQEQQSIPLCVVCSCELLKVYRPGLQKQPDQQANDQNLQQNDVDTIKTKCCVPCSRLVIAAQSINVTTLSAILD